MPKLTDTVAGRTMRILGFGWVVLLTVCAAASLANASAPVRSPPQKGDGAETVGVATPASLNPSAGTNAVVSTGNLAQKWGIQVSGLFLSAGGNMVDFRYKMLDPAKAAFLTRPETKPELLNQSSGAKLIVPDTPKVGQLRQITRQPAAGKMYFILFANTRHHVKSGDKVTIAAGDFKLENLVVE